MNEPIKLNLRDLVTGIDHLALAVPDLDAAVNWVCGVLGFDLVERRETIGANTGMKSAVLRMAGITLVLTEGIGENSPITQYLGRFGAGVQHVAFRVKDLGAAIETATGNGMRFSSPRLDSDGLSQIFSLRSNETGLMVEFIERRNYDGFRDENVQRLFDSLEKQELV